MPEGILPLEWIWGCVSLPLLGLLLMYSFVSYSRARTGMTWADWRKEWSRWTIGKVAVIGMLVFLAALGVLQLITRVLGLLLEALQGD
jgi:hypothetical protein